MGQKLNLRFLFQLKIVCNMNQSVTKYGKKNDENCCNCPDDVISLPKILCNVNVSRKEQKVNQNFQAQTKQCKFWKKLKQIYISRHM